MKDLKDEHLEPSPSDGRESLLCFCEDSERRQLLPLVDNGRRVGKNDDTSPTGARLFVRSFSASVGASTKSLHVVEGERGMNFALPTFHSKCEFELHGLAPGSHLTVGYIQVVEKRRFDMTYTQGKASWSFDGVPPGVMVSDANASCRPFYGRRTETVSVRGDGTSSTRRFKISMTDQPSASLTWRLPVEVCAQDCVSGTASHWPELRKVERQQKFLTWIAVMDHVARTITPLLAVRWEVDLTLDVNTSKDIGRRVRCRPVRCQPPKLLRRPPTIPWSTLQISRTANEVDKLVWRLGKREEMIARPLTSCFVPTLAQKSCHPSDSAVSCPVSLPVSLASKKRLYFRRPGNSVLDNCRKSPKAEFKSYLACLSALRARTPSQCHLVTE